MCIQYNGNLKDLIIMPFDLYYSNMCYSYDRTSLILISIARLCLYIVGYHYFGLYLQKISLSKYIENILIVMVLLNVISLSIAIARVPEKQKPNI